MSDGGGSDDVFRRRSGEPDDVFRCYSGATAESADASAESAGGVAPVEEGFNSSSSCTVRVSNCLIAFRNVGLSIDQSEGQAGVDSIPNEFDLALALLPPSEVIDERLDSGGLRV